MLMQRIMLKSRGVMVDYPEYFPNSRFSLYSTTSEWNEWLKRLKELKNDAIKDDRLSSFDRRDILENLSRRIEHLEENLQQE